MVIHLGNISEYTINKAFSNKLVLDYPLSKKPEEIANNILMNLT